VGILPSVLKGKHTLGLSAILSFAECPSSLVLSLLDTILHIMSALDVGLILLGLLILVAGGELLVRGASTMASRWGLSPLAVGLTVVAVGTSSPELAVSVGAVLRGEMDLAVGNVVGSNIANVLLILGVAALVLPLAVKEHLVRIDVPAMIVASVALLFCALDGVISTLDGILLLGLMLSHTILTVTLSRRVTAPKTHVPVQAATKDVGEPHEGAKTTRDGDAGSAATLTTPIAVLLVLVGIALLAGGANLLVTGAVNVATSLGVSGLVVGLTIVAVGTSMPELITSVVAALRGERDIAVGNVVGSCIANIGLVLGLPALFTSGGIPVASAAIAVDIPLLLAAAVVVAPIAFTGFTVQRWEGALLVGLYLAYVAYVVLDATGHQAQSGFTWTMTFFVFPLLVLTLATTVGYSLRRRIRPGTNLSATP